MIHISVFIAFIGQGFISSVEILRLLISFFFHPLVMIYNKNVLHI